MEHKKVPKLYTSVQIGNLLPPCLVPNVNVDAVRSGSDVSGC